MVDHDPALASKVIPDYELGCKRIIFTHDFLPIFKNKHCSLIDEEIVEVTENGEDWGRNIEAFLRAQAWN